MDDVKLGQLVTSKQRRDAVHVPIVPVVAGETLMPGQRIGLIGNKAYADAEYMGIVDPFLEEPVFRDYNFWMCLPPGTIISLRHHWDHPAFGPDDIHADPESVKWIENLAASVDLTFERLMAGAARYLVSGDYIVGGDEMEGESVPDEFWDHYQNVIGRIVPNTNKGNFFSCACG